MLFKTSLKKQQGLFRERVLRQPFVCDFSNNDYLSLSTCPEVKSAYLKSFAQHSVGSGGSMLIGGYQAIHAQLEHAFCEALGADSAVLFASGYAANLGIMALLADANCTAIFDKAIHASIYDGAKLSGTTYQRYPHQAYEVLKKKIQLAPQPAVLIAESVYSMGGHFSPLSELALLAEPLEGFIVDEAHSFGVYGKKGLGAVPHFGLSQAQVPLRVISLGKALHAQGAIVVGQRDWIEALIQVSRGYIYSTGMSPAWAGGLVEVFKIIQQADEARSKLFKNVAYFRQRIKESALKWMDSITPIQHLIVGCPHQAQALSEQLIEYGIYCRAIRPPTVLSKDSGLRVVLNAGHSQADLDFLFEKIDL